MWQHHQAGQVRGHIPTGAELDRVAGTNNYGRAVLARWRHTSRAGSAFPGRSQGSHAVEEREGNPCRQRRCSAVTSGKTNTAARRSAVARSDEAPGTLTPPQSAGFPRAANQEA